MATELNLSELKKKAEAALSKGIGATVSPTTILALIARVEELELPLKMLYEENTDYITRNNLGDVHHNQSMKLARAALAGRK